MKNTFLLLLTMMSSTSFAAVDLKQIKLPPGYEISIFAEAPGARSMALSPKGTLFIGNRQDSHEVYAIPNATKPGKHEAKVILKGLNSPNGVAVRDGDLFVAEISRILRYKDIEKRLNKPGKPEIFNDTFPKEGHHGWKFIRFAKDGSLIVPVGAPCNICEPDKDHAAIFRVSPDGKTKEVIAQGVRNTVGFDFDPESGDLFFTENGRDMLGDDIPSDELNRLKKPLESKKTIPHFGYPYCHEGTIKDPEFGSKRDCKEFEKPVVNLGAHVAALGMRFYKNQIFIAEHGSWNRSSLVGYRIVTVQGSESKVFAEGWLDAKGNVSGRPVDIEFLPDGSMLVSDDLNGVIYQIRSKN